MKNVVTELKKERSKLVKTIKGLQSKLLVIDKMIGKLVSSPTNKNKPTKSGRYVPFGKSLKDDIFNVMSVPKSKRGKQFTTAQISEMLADKGAKNIDLSSVSAMMNNLFKSSTVRRVSTGKKSKLFFVPAKERQSAKKKPHNRPNQGVTEAVQTLVSSLVHKDNAVNAEEVFETLKGDFPDLTSKTVESTLNMLRKKKQIRFMASKKGFVHYAR